MALDSRASQMSRYRILFIATHPKEVASTRYRVLSYGPALKEAGFDFDVQVFFSSEALRSMYSSWAGQRQIRFFLQGAWERWRTLQRNQYDLIFIHRELFPWGMRLGMFALLSLLKKSSSRFIYDFDDAIYLPHRQNRFLIGKLENPASVQQLIGISDQVIAGNSYLVQYAGQFNRCVKHIPTPVDTTRFFPSGESPSRETCTIGWIGSPSTTKYILGLAPVFERLAKIHPFRLKIIGSDRPLRLNGVQVEHRPWSLFSEAEEFRTCDVGVYPLWNDEWSRGKCGFKALQFMASGVPVVASGVGMNTEIIQDGVNGLLARSPEQWVEGLSQLLGDESLRQQLGMAGRQTVEDRYSLERVTPTLIETIHSTLDQSRDWTPKKTEGRRVYRVSQEPQDILCFSSIDWDFVWQGHQEIMSTLAAQGNRILFIENTGVRNPQLRDLPRIRHRLTEWWRSLQGFRKEQENLYIFSPLVLPFPYSRIARWINRWLLISALQRWIHLMDFYQPICWTFLPTPITVDVIRKIPYKLLIYHCVDSFVDSTPAAKRIVPSEQELFRQADLVFVTSQQLYDRAAQWNREVHLFPSGVNFQAAEKIRHVDEAPPEELRHLKRPLIGYVGGVHQWIDQELLCRLAENCRDYSFVLIGPIQTDAGLLRRQSNVLLLGQKSNKELPRYLKQIDVGLIPYRLTEYTKNVYPAKLNDYHAMGKPVVSTPLQEVLAFNQRTQNLVKIGATAPEFQEAVEQALREDSEALQERRVASARDNSWVLRIEQMQNQIQRVLARKASRSSEYWPIRFTASLKSARLLFRSVIGLALLYGVTFHTPLVWFLAEPLTVKEQPQPADVIVVFAGGVGESGEVSEGYQNLVKQAVELYRLGLAPKILYISGHTWTFQEADLMKILTESLGVPSSAVLTEKRVRNTYDYVLRIKEMSPSYGWKSLLVVTSRYHGLRTALTFSKNAPELTVTQVRGRTGYYDHTWDIRPTQLKGILHEYAGILYYRWKGWISLKPSS